VPTRINIIAGTLSQGSTSLTFNTAGTAAAIPVWWRGCKTTPGDQDNNPAAVAGTDIPSIQFTSGGLTANAPYQAWSNLDITGATTSGGLFNGTSSNQIIYGCRFRQTAGASVRCVALSGNSGTMVRCYVSAVSGQRCIDAVSATGNLFLGNYITGGNSGISHTSAPAAAIHCNVFDSIGGDAIQFSTGWGTIIGNSIYAPAGHGVNWTSTPGFACHVANNHFEGVNQASKAAINNASGTASTLIRIVSNSYYDCTAIVAGQDDMPAILDVGTLAGSGFINAAGDDFTPSALLLAMGLPGQFEAISAFRGWMTPGALQAQSGGGGPCGGYMGMP